MPALSRAPDNAVCCRRGPSSSWSAWATLWWIPPAPLPPWCSTEPSRCGTPSPGLPPRSEGLRQQLAVLVIVVSAVGCVPHSTGRGWASTPHFSPLTEEQYRYLVDTSAGSQPTVATCLPCSRAGCQWVRWSWGAARQRLGRGWAEAFRFWEEVDAACRRNVGSCAAAVPCGAFPAADALQLSSGATWAPCLGPAQVQGA